MSANRETPEAMGSRPSANDRRSFLRRSTLLTLVGVPAGAAITGTSPARAEDDGNDRDDLRTQFESIRTHENAHVAFLVKALGKLARPKPTFQKLEQYSFRDFLHVSQALENTGVGAYLGAAPAIASRAYLAAAGSIAFIEARHAGFLNNTVGSPITAGIEDLTDDMNFEEPLTAAQVRAQAGAFIKGLNGGPPVDYSADPKDEGDKNDIAILNFALALEYLEADYYNINVPKFYGKRR